MATKHLYFVSYAHLGAVGTSAMQGFGCGEMVLDKPITKIADISAIHTYLTKFVREPVVLNFQLLRTEER